MAARGKLRRRWSFGRSEHGSAAVEFAIWTAILAPIVINTVDLGMYVYDRVQVANASQTAVQAAWSYWYANCQGQSSSSNCDGVKVNGVSGGFTTAVKNAITQSSNLGVTAPTSVITGSTSVAEHLYCAPTAGGALTATTTSCPTGWNQGFYYALTVSYSFHPLFGGASVTSLLPSPITQTSLVRLQ
jgi:Flp pilus assembly protein TadG